MANPRRPGVRPPGGQALNARPSAPSDHTCALTMDTSKQRANKGRVCLANSPKSKSVEASPKHLHLQAVSST